MTEKSLSSKRRKAIAAVIILFIVIGVVTLTVVDGLIKPPYVIKSVVKLVMFLLVPILSMKFYHIVGINGLLRINPKKLLWPLGIGIAIYSIILGLFFVLRNSIDLSGITFSLADIGVTRGNFIYIALYISFMNSLLEELFFRGMGFIILGHYTGLRTACIFSSLLFATYHIAMMIGWYSLPLTFALVFGLFAGGIVLNLTDKYSESILPSWIIHIFANLSINTIGFILFTT